jgi:MbtH protein
VPRESMLLAEASPLGRCLDFGGVTKRMSQRIDDESAQDDEEYQVVVNDEEQYSIWPLGRELPLGWRAAGKEGPKADCLAYIDEVWTDMRPLSLRKSMDASSEGSS